LEDNLNHERFLDPVTRQNNNLFSN
jgi:hypothetical protein